MTTTIKERPILFSTMVERSSKAEDADTQDCECDFTNHPPTSWDATREWESIVTSTATLMAMCGDVDVHTASPVIGSGLGDVVSSRGRIPGL